MPIHTLDNSSLEIIAEAFNKAFESYFVPIKLDAKSLEYKIKSENILLEHSIGLTINNQLAGFILIGIDADSGIAYNAGTGIIPEFRGQKLTEKMYSFLLPKLQKIGIQYQLLEVICENINALKVYKNLKYSISRKLICYKGTISQPKKSDYQIETIDLPNEAELKKFRNHSPAYQNSLFCIKNNAEKHTTYGVLNNEKLIGYIVFDKNTLRIKQFGVDKAFRNNGLGQQLFNEVQIQIPEKEISIINVDENDMETNKFLGKIGLKPFIEQYEMVLNRA